MEREEYKFPEVLLLILNAADRYLIETGRGMKEVDSSRVTQVSGQGLHSFEG